MSALSSVRVRPVAPFCTGSTRSVTVRPYCIGSRHRPAAMTMRCRDACLQLAGRRRPVSEGRRRCLSVERCVEKRQCRFQPAAMAACSSFAASTSPPIMETTVCSMPEPPMPEGVVLPGRRRADASST